MGKIKQAYRLAVMRTEHDAGTDDDNDVCHDDDLGPMMIMMSAMMMTWHR
jgi:hypothetical protein